MTRSPSHMRIWLIAVVFIALSAPCPTVFALMNQPGDTPLATVNGVAITAGDVQRETDLIDIELQRRNRPLNPDRRQHIQAEILQTLIEREVLHQQSQRVVSPPRPSQVQEAMAELRDRIGGRADLSAYLNAAGISQARFEERLARAIAIQTLLRQEVLRGIRISEAEMQAFFRRHPEHFKGNDQWRVRHLLVTFHVDGDDRQRQDALRRITRIQQHIASGEPLAVMALTHSACPSKSYGGDLGYLTREQMPAPFAEALHHMEPGQISDIVTTHLGFHLIELMDHKPAAPIVYQHARSKIERTLRRNKEAAAIEAYLVELKRQADITWIETPHAQ